ncbi:hypothetical protein K435DRAFT_804277 [Dendrothele bispora CBS 962.96]|uniref:Uncharacterized protein n=2 Tax=Dendrothele bispora (strain CBS 962.96) TaxID=1314807 RepID=A0A4S8LFL4_DENBC|nr:hypothetical protein K435DRAFT_804277 [Dendrothele bispora CBS 962.96]
MWSMDSVPEVVQEIISYVASLQDFSRLLSVNRTFRDVVSFELRKRIRYILTSRYVPESCYSDFNAELGRNNSILTGGVAHLFCGTDSTWPTLTTFRVNAESPPLQIIRPRGTLLTWKLFLEDRGFYESGDHEEEIGILVEGLASYCHQDTRGTIVVIQSRTRSPFTVLLGEKSSTQRQGISDTYVFDLHPQLTEAGWDVSTQRDYQEKASMRTCDIACTGQWYNLDPSAPTKIETSYHPLDVRRPPFIRYGTRENFTLGEYCRKHTWSLKGRCLNVRCPWFSVDLRMYSGKLTTPGNTMQNVPSGLLYSCELGDLDYVPIPAIADHRSSYYFGELRLPMENSQKGRSYLICSNQQNLEGLAENQSLYSAMKGSGYSVCPLWKGNLLVLCIEGTGLVKRLSGMDRFWVNKAVCRVCTTGEPGTTSIRVTSVDGDKCNYLVLVGSAVIPAVVERLVIQPAGLYVGPAGTSCVEVVVPSTVALDCSPQVKETLTSDTDQVMFTSTEEVHPWTNYWHPWAKAIRPNAIIKLICHETHSKELVKVFVADGIEIRVPGQPWTPRVDGNNRLYPGDVVNHSGVSHQQYTDVSTPSEPGTATSFSSDSGNMSHSPSVQWENQSDRGSKTLSSPSGEVGGSMTFMGPSTIMVMGKDVDTSGGQYESPEMDISPPRQTVTYMNNPGSNGRLPSKVEVDGPPDSNVTTGYSDGAHRGLSRVFGWVPTRDTNNAEGFAPSAFAPVAIPNQQFFPNDDRLWTFASATDSNKREGPARVNERTDHTLVSSEEMQYRRHQAPVTSRYAGQFNRELV